MVYINVESVKNRWRKTSKDNYIWFSDLPLVQNSCSKTGKIYACFLCHCFNWKMTFDVNFYPMHQVKFINFINNMYIVNTLPKRYRQWRVRDTDRGDWEIQTVATDLQRQLNNTKCVITGTGGDNRHGTSLRTTISPQYTLIVTKWPANRGPSWSWSWGNWLNNYLCNQCLSLLKLWVWIPLMMRCTRYNIMW